jgi:ribosome-binding factor A
VSRRNQRGNRGYARTDRLGSSLREIIGEELRRINDDYVAFITVTDVDVDNELTRARVYFSTLNLEDEDLEGLYAHMGRIRKAIARQGNMRRVPDLEFHIDPGLKAGTRVGEILQTMEARDDRAFTETSEEE